MEPVSPAPPGRRTLSRVETRRFEDWLLDPTRKAALENASAQEAATLATKDLGFEVGEHTVRNIAKELGLDFFQYGPRKPPGTPTGIGPVPPEVLEILKELSRAIRENTAAILLLGETLGRDTATGSQNPTA